MTAVPQWQAVLAGEHAAVYAYGVIGGRLPADSAEQSRAEVAFVEHEEARDEIVDRLRAQSAEPTPPATGYRLSGPVDTPAQATALAAQVEDRLCVLYADLVSTTTGDDRAFAVDRMIDTATALVDWGRPPTSLPGVGRV